MSLLHCPVAHSSNNVALEDEINDSNGDNPNNIRSKARSIIIKVLTCVVILEEWQSPHLGVFIEYQERKHEVIPEPEGIDNQLEIGRASCRERV